MKQHESDIFSHRRNRIAFKEITRQEASAFVTKSKRKKMVDKATQWGFMIAAPNAVAGALGYCTAGLEGGC